MKRFFAQAMVIARRDFSAIVLTPTFLIFLLAPLFMMSVATIGSLGAVRVVEGSRERAIVIATSAEAAALRGPEERLQAAVAGDPGPPPVAYEAPQSDLKTQAAALLRRGGVAAVMFGSPQHRVVLHGPRDAREGAYLALLGASSSGVQPVVLPVAGTPSGGHKAGAGMAFGAIFAMFFLSLLLASQTISMLSEERNNKVIEILAAAVPLEAVFFGKLLGMLGVALLFTLFWGAIATSAAWLEVGGLSLEAIAPASGLASFAALFLAYFMLCFLLLGAVFLGVGAQASTMREIQMLSLPVTIFQVAMFAVASAGAGASDSATGLFAAIFPFSSPFAMAGRAAAGVPSWQHAAALLWQLLWLAITVTVAARLFRRGVLKSGGAPRG